MPFCQFESTRKKRCENPSVAKIGLSELQSVFPHKTVIYFTVLATFVGFILSGCTGFIML